MSGAYIGALSCVNSPASVGPNIGTTAINPITSGADLANFSVTPVNGSYTIDPALVTATGGSGSSTYDGASHSPSACLVTGAYIGALSCVNSLASVGPGIGTTSISPITSGANLANFTVTPANGSYTINPALVTATAGSGSNIYDGLTHSPSVCVVSGAYIGGLSCVNSPASVGPGFGTTTISPITSGADLANFTVTPANGSYTINKRAATWTTNPNSKIFGSLDPVPLTTGSGSNFVASDGVTATYARVTGEDVGTYQITATLSPTAALANYNITNAGALFTIGNWTLTGFYQPVDMIPVGVLNTVKGGSTVPLKFNIYAGTPGPTTERKSLSDVLSFQYQEFTCGATGTFEAPIEVTTTGGTSLRYDGTAGQFIENWQLPKPPNKCYQVRMTALDGSHLDAFFKTK